MKKRYYIGRVIKRRMLSVYVRFSFLLKGLFLISIFYNLPGFEIMARNIFINENEESSIIYDVVPVNITVVGVGEFNLDVLYTDDDLLYVNIEDLFKTLNIPCSASQKGDNLGGFIEDEGWTYLIDFHKGQIKVGDKTINSQKGLLNKMGSFYMESSLFAKAFGLMLTFNFRTLSINLKSDFELPIVKTARLKKMRNNISRIKGEVIADTIVGRNYHLFKFGTLDWSVASFQSWNGSTDNQFGLGVGAELLYGELDLAVNYFDRYEFDQYQLQYLWRWVDNDNSIIKQAQVGKIYNQTISFINAPVIGAVIRNSPTTIGKAKGYYTINEFTEPNWTVELYINNVLLDYTEADASGSFMFKIPIVYGYTTLKLKFYGPMGEERTEERTMNVPYTVMPAGEFEYSISAGVLEDSSLSRLGKAELNYGVNRFLTVGGGLEYLSSIPNGPFIPYANATIQPFGKLTLNGEYAHGVRARGILFYYLYKNAVLEIDYTKYVEGQLATRFNAHEERKVKLTVPLKFEKINGLAKLDFTQFVYKTFNYNYTSVMFSAYYKQFSANSSSQLNWMDNTHASESSLYNTQVYVTSDLSLSYRLKKGYTIRPSARYDVSKTKLVSYKVSIEKFIPKGYFTVSYERYLSYDDHFFTLNFKYNLPFARTSTSASFSKGNVYTSESAQGSLAFGSGNKYVHHSNNSSVSKGGVSLYPFLDLNQNSIFDDGEQMVKITSVRIRGGKPIFGEKDSIVRIPDLYAFTSYNVEFNDNDLENIAWRFKNKIYSVLIDPNQFKRIDIPVIAIGEVNGSVSIENDSLLKGIGRIIVNICNNDGLKCAQTLSESDGYINYLGLEPGIYTARIDSVQLSRLNLTASPAVQPFQIKAIEDGDIVDGIDFILSGIQDKIESVNVTQDLDMITENHIKSILLKMDISFIGRRKSYVYWGTFDLTAGPYFVQAGAFRNESSARQLAKRLKRVVQYPLGIKLEDGYYKVRIGYFKTTYESEMCYDFIKKMGYTLFRGRDRSNI